MGTFQKLLAEVPVENLQKIYEAEHVRLRPVVSDSRNHTLCIWCGNAKPKTRDHLIPRWFVWIMPYYRISHLPLSHYPACSTCNQRKGPLPPAVYHEVRAGQLYARRGTKEWQRETREWLDIAAYFRLAGGLSRVPVELVDYVLNVMAKPVPFVTEARVPKNSRKRRHAAHLHEVFNDERSKATLSSVWPSVASE